MTATETTPQVAAAPSPAGLPAWRRAFVFGTGFGIALGERNLRAAIARARPSGPTLVSEITIQDFRTRPAAEWGSELLKFLSAAGEAKLAATVLLPRRDVIVRTLDLPGVADKDAPGAIELQIETLHPWGDEEIVWSWARAGASSFLVGLIRKSTIGAWETLFSEAGIPLAAITFLPAVAHAALRIWSTAPASVLAYSEGDSGQTEIYGESPARPVYSTEFSVPFERALAIARSELRLPPDQTASALGDTLPKPLRSTASLSALPPAQVWAAALAGAVPRAARIANLLPPERRVAQNRIQYVLPAALAVLLTGALLAWFVILPSIEQRRYRDDLNQAVRRLEPGAAHVRNLERTITSNQARIVALDEFRGRTQADLEVMNELTRLLPTDTWTNAIEIYPDSVIISGEAAQAAPLVKLLDSSPLFQNSEFVSSVTRTAAQTETFRIKTMRRGRIGRTTP